MKQQTEMDEILNALEHVTKITAPDGFDERLFKSISHRVHSGIIWLKIGLAAMIVMAVVNITTLIYSTSTEPETNNFESLQSALLNETQIDYFNIEEE